MSDFQSDDPAAWGQRAVALAQSGDESGAIEIYRAALARFPGYRDFLFNLGNSLYRQDSFAQAEESFAQILVANPSDVKAWLNRGLALKALDRWDEAEGAYKQAMALADPAGRAHALYNLANLYLAQGRWREGFAAFEARRVLPGALAAPWGLPSWTKGLPPGARVLLWNDQGLGDGLMFVRFARRFAQRFGVRVSGFVQAPLKRLFVESGFFEEVFSPEAPPQPFDAQFPLGSLPYALDVKSDADLAAEPYLAGQEKREVAQPAKQIGLVWAGNPHHANDARRSFALADFAPLFDRPGLSRTSFQVGPRAEELRASPWAGRVRDLSAELTDFAATARAMAAMDLILSVDTAPVHLAGTMGVPTWVFLPASGIDWRWGRAGEATVWYPSLRLFRSHDKENRAAVIERAARLLG